MAIVTVVDGVKYAGEENRKQVEALEAQGLVVRKKAAWTYRTAAKPEELLEKTRKAILMASEEHQ